MPADVPTLVFSQWRRANGFVRKGTHLYRDQPETIAVVNLQGSRYGGRYYLNIGLWLKAVGEQAAPKVQECHLQARLSMLPEPEVEEADEVYLDLESDLSDGERRRMFRSVLDAVVTPALERTGTHADLQARPESVRRWLVDADDYRLLGLPGVGMEIG